VLELIVTQENIQQREQLHVLLVQWVTDVLTKIEHLKDVLLDGIRHLQDKQLVINALQAPIAQSHQTLPQVVLVDFTQPLVPQLVNRAQKDTHVAAQP